MWRLIADFMNDLGMLMDLLSPLLPSAFLFILCLGSLSRSFTGVASGATRAALTQHFALQDNAADISAKEGSQETVATMIGMAFGMLLARITNGHAIAIWISFLSLTIFHMYANYKAVSCLSLTTLNCERSSILLSHFFKTGQVLSPKQVSTMEHILPLWMTSWSSTSTLHKNVSLGVRITSLKFHEIDSFSLMSREDIAGSHYREAKYLLLEKNGIVSIVVHKDSTAADILQSFVSFMLLSCQNLLAGSEMCIWRVNCGLKSTTKSSFQSFNHLVGKQNAFCHLQLVGEQNGYWSLLMIKQTNNIQVSSGSLLVPVEIRYMAQFYFFPWEHFRVLSFQLSCCHHDSCNIETRNNFFGDPLWRTKFSGSSWLVYNLMLCSLSEK